MLRRVLRTVQVTLSHVFAPDEIPAAATGTPTITITRLDGTVVVATTATTGPDENDAYTFTWAGSATLDRLRVAWGAIVNGDAVTIDQDVLEIVGGHMFGITEARDFDKSIASTVKFPTKLLEATRIEVEDEAENICQQAFVPRFERELLDGTGRGDIRLAWPLTRVVRKVSVATSFGSPFVDFTSTQLANVAPGIDGVLRLDSGFFMSTSNWLWGALWPLGRQNVLIEYEHGLDGPPADIGRAGKIRLRSMVLEPESALVDRAESSSTAQAGNVFGPVDADHTGIPAVDAAYARNPGPRPSFG